MADHTHPALIGTRGDGTRTTRVGGDVGVAEAPRRFGDAGVPRLTGRRARHDCRPRSSGWGDRLPHEGDGV